jgi:hypothetical protein
MVEALGGEALSVACVGTPWKESESYLSMENGQYLSDENTHTYQLLVLLRRTRSEAVAFLCRQDEQRVWGTDA